MGSEVKLQGPEGRTVSKAVSTTATGMDSVMLKEEPQIKLPLKHSNHVLMGGKGHLERYRKVMLDGRCLTLEARL